jgi:hypothetical protein
MRKTSRLKKLMIGDNDCLLCYQRWILRFHRELFLNDKSLPKNWVVNKNVPVSEVEENVGLHECYLSFWSPLPGKDERSDATQMAAQITPNSDSYLHNRIMWRSNVWLWEGIYPNHLNDTVYYFTFKSFDFVREIKNLTMYSPSLLKSWSEEQ